MKIKNLTKLLISFMGGGKIDFPTRNLKEIEIEPEPTNDDSEDNIQIGFIEGIISSNYRPDKISVQMIDENENTIFFDVSNLTLDDFLSDLTYDTDHESFLYKGTYINQYNESIFFDCLYKDDEPLYQNHLISRIEVKIDNSNNELTSINVYNIQYGNNHLVEVDGEQYYVYE